MRDEDYQLVEHPRLELHIHVATKFVQVIFTMIIGWHFGGDVDYIY